MAHKSLHGMKFKQPMNNLNIKDNKKYKLKLNKLGK